MELLKASLDMAKKDLGFFCYNYCSYGNARDLQNQGSIIFELIKSLN
jgi:hypothetical protein